MRKYERISNKPDELFASSYLQPYTILPEEVVARLVIKRAVELEDDDDLTPEANALLRLQIFTIVKGKL